MKNKPILYLDLDDTISNTYETILEYACLFDKKYLNGSGKIKKIDSCKDYYYFAFMLGWSRENVKQFFDTYYLEFLPLIKVKENVAESLKLIHKNYNIHILTSRREKSGEIYTLTKQWLKKYEIPYDKLIINAIDKSEFINDDNKESIFIDDSFENCVLVFKKKKINVMMMKNIYNSKLKSKDFIVINDWLQLEKMLCCNEE